MKVLVTGGAGFIGSHLVDRLIKDGYDVSVVDNLSSGKEINLNPGAKFYKLDILSPSLKKLFSSKKKFDYIFHLAAQIDVRKSVENPVFDAEVNVLGSLKLLSLCLKKKPKKFIYASTGGAIYGEPDYLPADENHPIHPNCAYGVSKHTVEHYLELFRTLYHLKYTIFRFPNVYGPRQDPNGEAGVVSIFIGRMLKGKTPFIFGDGTQLRDYLYVDDIVEAMMISLRKGDNRIYNLGSVKGSSVNELFKKLRKIIGFKKGPNYSAPRLGEVNRIYLSAERAKKELSWQPEIELENGLAKTVSFFKSHPEYL